ncbi:lipid-associated family protein [Hibiscus syriacus]|uniref:Lipid-associated family protein n=1 Tax=Hibiscus syriacus TaxID=106335 RepID=A0A6A2ZX76_HIBSY|nr:rho GTPase-activating protein gacK-like [Hibiscus syriacus]KAE8696017.1 lipid-associated family protein [Hibiscus syriacus]
MDSGNSGSVHSSSGGSEEFDSRANSFSAFFNSNTSSHVGHDYLGIQQPSQPAVMQRQLHHHQSQSPSSMFFDPLSSYFDHPLSSATNQNLDVVWSKNTRFDPGCNDLAGFMASQQAHSRTTFSSVQIPVGSESGKKASVSGTTDQQPSNNSMVRNSKKRSRASRRAPTTVLTTDTINFRAMVQEFTGIPAPPFSSSPFPRTRLDLFGTSPSMRSTQLDPSSPHYLLRPFAQKLQYPPPFITFSSSKASSSMVDDIASTPSTNSTSSTTSINYHLPQNPPNNIGMQNPILNFVSLLETPQKYPVSNSTGSLNIPSNESLLRMGVFEEFGMSQGHGNTNLSGFQNTVPSSSTWSQDVNDQSLVRSINDGGYNGNTQRVTNGKGNNFPVLSSDFHGDKGQENVATKGEGMVESWICSSD